MTAVVPDRNGQKIKAGTFPRLSEQTNVVVARHAVAIWPATCSAPIPA
jgi:hypothetical protein